MLKQIARTIFTIAVLDHIFKTPAKKLESKTELSRMERDTLNKIENHLMVVQGIIEAEADKAPSIAEANKEIRWLHAKTTSTLVDVRLVRKNSEENFPLFRKNIADLTVGIITNNSLHDESAKACLAEMSEIRRSLNTLMEIMSRKEAL